jgi:hypothetical protein
MLGIDIWIAVVGERSRGTGAVVVALFALFYHILSIFNLHKSKIL